MYSVTQLTVVESQAVPRRNRSSTQHLIDPLRAVLASLAGYGYSRRKSSAAENQSMWCFSVYIKRRQQAAAEQRFPVQTRVYGGLVVQLARLQQLMEQYYQPRHL